MWVPLNPARFARSHPRVRSAHHFCETCYIEWAERNSSCPTCRAPVWCIARDLEFAQLVGAKITPSRPKRKPKAEKARIGADGETETEGERPDSPPGGSNVVTRTVELLGPAGLTIGNAPGNQSGCIVVKVRRGNGGDRARIRVGDRILKASTPQHGPAPPGPGLSARWHRECRPATMRHHHMSHQTCATTA